MAQYIEIDGERADCVTDPRGFIKKVTLTFAAKFFLLLVQHQLSPAKADTVLTWDRVVMVATLVVVLEIDFARMIITRGTREGIEDLHHLPISMSYLPKVKGH